MPKQLSWLLIYLTGTPPWFLRTVKVFTSSELYPYHFWLPTFLDCPGIQFFNSPFSPTQSVRLSLVTYPSLCRAYVSYRTQYHASSHQVLPIQLMPRNAEDFPRGGSHSKHLSLLTYLAWLQPTINNSRLIFRHVKIKSCFTCG